MTAQQRLPAEERRRLILEAALDAFAEKGFNGARTKDVAQRAEVSETLIFQHFANKEELYRAALEHLYADHPLLEDMEEPLARMDDEALFTSMALHMLRHTRRDPRIVRLFLFEALDAQVPAPATDMMGGAALAPLAEYIRQRERDGVFAACEPRFASKLFHYVVFLAVADRQLRLLGEPLAMDDEELAQRVSQTVLNGLRAR